METINTDIVVIGAGLTGLALAYTLQKNGKKVIVLEKDCRAGGVISTVSEGGFIYETGPNTGVLSSPEIAALFEELSGLCSLEIANQGAKKRYILKKGKWEALPSGPISAITTPLFTLKDKFRILGEPFRKPGTDPDEPLSEMVIRRLGKSFLDYAVDPFISGIYAGDPATLIPRYALPKLYALEQKYGSFIKGAIQKAKEPKTDAQKKATGDVFSVQGGLYNLITAMAKEIGKENLLTDIADAVVSPSGKGFVVTYSEAGGEQNQIFSSSVVTTFGGSSVPRLLPFISEEELAPIAQMKYAGVVQAAVGYREWKGSELDAFGGLIPSKENRGALGILYPSAIFKGRAPEKGAMLSVFLGGIKKPDIIGKSDDEIKTIVLKEIGETLYQHNQPDLLRIFRYTHAIPQYEKSTGERLELIRKIEAQYPGLILAGNIRDGIGMSDRVKQAKQVAAMIIAVNHEK